jgi:hypothetical protein
MRPQLLLAALTALVSASCYSPGDGIAPPLDKLYFPTGLALDTPPPLLIDGKPILVPPAYLYVASSDFDLQYRSSGLISFDLDAVRAKLPRNCSTIDDCETGERCDTPEGAKADVPDLPASYVASYLCVTSGALQPCGEAGERDPADRLLYPGRCGSFDQAQFIHSVVGIGAFASDVIYAANPAAEADGTHKARLFLPVRGDATLHWIDLDDGKLKCDQESTDDDSCGQSHRAGHDTATTPNNIYQPSEPFAIAATENGKYLAMTNQTSGSVSLYTHEWDSEVGPQLVSIIYGLPTAPVAIAAVPTVLNAMDDPAVPGVEFAPAPGFLVAYRNAAQVDLLRVRNDALDGSPEGSYSRYTLTYAGSAAIGVNSLGYDSRDIVIDDSQRKADCADQDPATHSASTVALYHKCLRAGPQPDIFLANRTPSSLVVGKMTADASYATGSNDLPSFTDSIALTTGPSRLVRGMVRVAPDPNHVADATHGVLDDSSPKHPTYYDLEARVFIVCFDSTRIFVYDPARHVTESIIDMGRGPYALAVDEARGLLYVGFFTDSYLGVVSLDQRYRQTYASVIASIGTPSPPRSSK